MSRENHPEDGSGEGQPSWQLQGGGAWGEGEQVSDGQGVSFGGQQKHL